MPLDQTEATNQLNAETGKVAYVATVTPLRGRLLTAMGTATAAGTEVANAGGSTYASQDLSAALPNPAAGQVANNAGVTWPNLPTCTVVGIETWDSAGAPKRKRYGALTASKSVNLGDSLTMAPGALVMTQT
jgi:hypothetical protein